MKDSEKLLTFAIALIYSVISAARGSGSNSAASVTSAEAFIETAKQRGILPKLPDDPPASKPPFVR